MRVSPSERKGEAESVSSIGGCVGEGGSTQAIAVIEGKQRRDAEDHVASASEAGKRQASLVHLAKTERGEGSARYREDPHSDRQTSHG